MVKEGRFREDLLYRLWVVPITLPPLRDRPEDVELLIWHFIDRPKVRARRDIRGIHADAMRLLVEHRWPGNVRELQNVVEYAIAVGTGPELALDDLPPELLEEDGGGEHGRDEPASAVSAERIQAALAECGGNVALAAERLGMSRVTLWRRRKKLGI
jgi:transcriptional regulator with PAS, ATPase and Fis domain